MWFILGVLLCCLFVAVTVWLTLTLGALGLVVAFPLWACAYLAYHALQRRLGTNSRS